MFLLIDCYCFAKASWMPRKPFTPDPSLPYHVSARSNNRDWFSLPMEEVWTLYSDYLAFLSRAFSARIHSFVLMNNHFHMLARFPDNNMSEAMNYFMRETSRAIGFESRRINHVYGGRFFRSCLVSNHYFEHAYKYVYRNPVEAGLCDLVEEYKFSSLHGLLGHSRVTFPLEEDSMLFESYDLNSLFTWLNTPPSEESKEAVRWGLKQSNFKLPKVSFSKKPNPLEVERY